MKKKIVLFGVALAALATFNSCSNEDVLTQVVDTPAEEGEPLVVKLVDTDGTRGTDYTATSLPAFYLYSVKNGGSERWIGEYSTAGVSKGATFKGNNGTFTNTDGITWRSGAWDFYALSDATFATETVGTEDKDAEHLDATDRNFTYTVNNDYNSQKDLLVAAVIGQQATTSTTVALPFYHALSRIKSVKLKFKATSESNDNYIFIIKSMTLKNIPSTAKFTFPAEWTKANLATAWGTATSLKDYTLTFPDFERDANGKIKVFEETQDDENIYENTGTAYAVTKRGGIDGFPNYITFPDYGTTTYEFPLATSAGVEDDGLYIIPQSLEKTKIYIVDGGSSMYYHFNTDADNNTYTTPYLEVTFLGLTDSAHDSSEPTTLNDFESVSNEYGGSSTGTGNWTNARITDAINNGDLYTVAIPLSALTFEAGKYHSLVAYINMAVDQNDGDVMIFSGAGID